MTFTTPSGPPATPKQMQFLEHLLRDAGYTSFGDARRVLGLSQRQAKGKFTVPEASELIDRLVAAGDSGEPAVSVDPDESLRTEQAQVLRGIPGELLAAELERRGWRAVPPA